MKLSLSTTASISLSVMVLTRSAIKAGAGSVRLATAFQSSGNVVTTTSSRTNKNKKRSGERALQESKAATQKGNGSKKQKSQSREPIFELPNDLVIGTLKCRPSKRNRSPYVADVFLEDEQREAIAHVPNLDMGGKCVPGARLLLKPARDKKGNLVGPNAVNPKYNTPKCEFHAQLLHVDESELGYEPAWVGAHPSLGERIAEELVGRNLLGDQFPLVESYQREVRNVGGSNMRADFVIQHKDPELPPRILEVKTVVDTDYSIHAKPNRDKCVFTSDKEPYVRTAIFPWGNSNQKGPDGEKVVSARAIKHVQELTKLVENKKTKFDATILFVVIRHDAKAFRPNFEACPSFTKYLKQAQNAGVQIIAKQVCWGDRDGNIGKCYEGDLLDIDWP